MEKQRICTKKGVRKMSKLKNLKEVRKEIKKSFTPEELEEI